MGVGTMTRPSSSERFLVGSFAVGHLSNDWAPGAVWLVAPAAAAAMGLGAPEVGLLLAIHGFGAALGYVPAGFLADRVARRGPLLVATFAWVAIGYALAALAPGFWSLALLLAVAVIGDAAWHPIATGVLVQRFPARRARVLGLHAMGGTLGAEVLAPVGVGLLLGFVDWRVALALSAVPAALCGIAFWWLVAKRVDAVRPPPPEPMRLGKLLAPWLRRDGRVFVAAIILYNMAYMAVLAMTPLFTQDELGFSAFQTGLTFAVMLVLGSVLQPVAGQLSDRVGRRPLLLGGTALGALGAIAAGLLPTGWGALAGIVLAIACLTAIRSVVLACAVEIAREREATHLGFAFTLMDGVGALGAAFAGFAGRETLALAFVLGAVLATLALIAFAAMRPISNAARPEGARAIEANSG